MPAPRHLTLVLALLGLPDLAAAAAPRANAPGSPADKSAKPTKSAKPGASAGSGEPAPAGPVLKASRTGAPAKPTPGKPGGGATTAGRSGAVDKPDAAGVSPAAASKTAASPRPARKPGSSGVAAEQPAARPAPAAPSLAVDPSAAAKSAPVDPASSKPGKSAPPRNPGPDSKSNPTPPDSAPAARSVTPSPTPDGPSAPEAPAKTARPGKRDAAAAPDPKASSSAPDPKASSSPDPGSTSPDPKASPASKRPRSARAARPPRDPLLAAHPVGCNLDPLEAVAQRQHERTRASLREFYWSDMARFFETTLDEAEPTPRQADDPAFLRAADVIAALPRDVRAPLSTLAAARVVDRLSERPWANTHKLLQTLAPADVAALLRADSPTLRAHVYTWLATTRQGGCHLGHLDLGLLEAAVADRSIAVEHGDDLVYRSLGDYALEARARLASRDPARFDAFLARLTADTEIDPLVRATAHGMLLRRAHWEALDVGLRDPSPPVRAATAAAAVEMNRDKLEARLVEHAASDPADLVTELVVGALLGVYDPHNHGKPQVRGLLATTRDERLTSAVERWRGRGDPIAPLPVPARPLRLAAAPQPVPTDSLDQPVPADSPAPALSPPQRPSGASPAAAAMILEAAEPPLPGRARTQPRSEPARPALPGVQDRDDDETITIPPVRP